ncbi:spore germination protein GerPC [Ornithinibacillus contaminans]|uniref:spore germination protein GerPC n=1 Tax=Ornithinibacillus contaminans TaxID=694055 RepID=UPI00064D849B|nr:spore germination protein GerPC [Ornithinibacillus contaminans]
MNMYEWNQYIAELQQITYRQQEQMKKLEEKINQLEKQLQENSGPSIDKIEYHFDQLKIERLDGTLHIGLSPNELANIDDLGIPNTNKILPTNTLNQKLLPSLNAFVKEQGPEMIRSFSNPTSKPIDQHAENAMVEDIIKQLPKRIAFYENQAREKHQLTTPQQLEAFISDHIKKEIYHSLQKYMQGNDSQKGES